MDDYQNKYNKRVKQEQDEAQKKRVKRKQKIESDKLKARLYFENLKEHSSGLITWKQKDNSYIWDGYIAEQKVFKISQGLFKYTLSLYPGIKITDKKHKNINTAFEFKNLELKAEVIAKNLPLIDTRNK